MSETGTVVITEQRWASVNKITYDWTCSSGVASKTTTHKYDGQVLRVVLGANVTTGGYTTVINDEDSIDILKGVGSTCSSGGSQLGAGEGNSPISCVAMSTLELSISGASSSSTGQTIIYIR